MKAFTPNQIACNSQSPEKFLRVSLIGKVKPISLTRFQEGSSIYNLAVRIPL
jgi:hypothetical protein